MSRHFGLSPKTLCQTLSDHNADLRPATWPMYGAPIVVIAIIALTVFLHRDESGPVAIAVHPIGTTVPVKSTK